MNMYPWQQNIFDKLMITMAGRARGKSVWTQQAIDQLMRDVNSQSVTDLILSEGTVYGARYYCVEPIGSDWMEIEQWVTDTYGYSQSSIWGETDRPAPRPGERWYADNRKFLFRNEADRTLFILRWA